MYRIANRIKGPVAVIGDVHGQLDKLAAILEQLRQAPSFSQRWIVFVGDLVDRGSDSRGVLELVTELWQQRGGTTVIAGNHDFAMSAALGLVPTPDYANWHKHWVQDYESETTFESYGVAHGDLRGLRSALPEAHAALLAGLPWCVEHPQYLFVHAGLDLNQPYELQLKILRKRDLTLSRPQWLCSKKLVQPDVPDDCPLTVVSGHLQVDQVEFYRKRILLDTAAGRDAPLSCVLLPENTVITSSGLQHAGTTSSGRSWWKLWGRG